MGKEVGLSVVGLAIGMAVTDFIGALLGLEVVGCKVYDVKDR